MENKPVKLPEAEVTISTEMKFEGKIITLQVDQVRLASGRIASRAIVRHPGATQSRCWTASCLPSASIASRWTSIRLRFRPASSIPERIPPSVRRGNCGGNRLYRPEHTAGGYVLHFAGVCR